MAKFIMADNLIKIQELLHLYQTQKKPGLLISFDFCKAFDHLEWDTVMYVLDKFGFSDYYKNW